MEVNPERAESVRKYSESRDLVDTMTQALTKLRDGQFLQNQKDERPVQHVETPKNVYSTLY